MFPRRSLSGTMLTIACLTLVVGVAAAGGAVLLGNNARQAQQELRAQVQINQGIEELKTLTTQVALLNAQRILVPTEKSIQAGLAGALVATAKRSQSLGALPLTDTERKAIKGYQGAIDTFVNFFNTPITAEQLRDPKILKQVGDTYNADLAAVDATQRGAGQASAAELATVDAKVSRVTGQLVTVVIALTVVAGLGIGAFLFWTARSIKAQLLRMTRVLSALHGGDLRQRVGATGTDELATMGRSLDETLDRLSQVFSGIGDASTELSHSSTQLQEVAARVGTAANGAAAQAQSASSTANDVSSSVQAVAVGSDEMGTSISEIARNAQQAVEVASTAVTSVEDTTGRMAKLSDSSREIGDVIRLITSIAEQTNLLALNATIEAARAGDAGKGFAVVADEVKQLAQETARATEDISRRVEAIQADAEQANEAIGDIANVIGRINEFQTTIASAVEEQTATTQDINRGVNHAASGSTQIAQNISELASAAETTALAAAETRNSADQLAGMSSRLNGLISTFRY